MEKQNVHSFNILKSTSACCKLKFIVFLVQSYRIYKQVKNIDVDTKTKYVKKAP